MLDFDSDPLILEPSPFFAPKSPKSSQSNPIFHFKRRGDRGLNLTYLDSWMTEFLPKAFLLSSISAIFRGKIGPKEQNFGYVLLL